MVNRMEITYDKNLDILDAKYIVGSTIGYTIPPRIYKISDNELMIKASLPNKLKVKITIDKTRLRSNLTTNKSIKFTKKSLFFTILRFTQSH